MQHLRSHIALLLLVCWTRTLLPEVWVLDLHAHRHTTEEPTVTPRLARAAKGHLFSPKHTHCHAEQFYAVPFVVGVTPPLPTPRWRPVYRAPRVLAVLAGAAGVVVRAAPRGPPVS